MEFRGFFKKGKDAVKKAGLVAGVGLVSITPIKGESAPVTGVDPSGDKNSDSKNINADIPVSVLEKSDTKVLGDKEEISFQKGFFLKRLKQEGLVDENLTEEEFQTFSEEQMRDLSMKYKEAIGAFTEDELPKDKKYETIARIRYGINENEVVVEGSNLGQDKADFEAWFAKQPEGTIQEYKGRKIKIDRSGNSKSVGGGSSKPEQASSSSSSSEKAEEFVYLKDKDYNK